MDPKYFLKRAGLVILLSSLSGAVIFYLTYYLEHLPIISSLKRYFEAHTLSPSILAMSMSLASLLALFTMQLRIWNISPKHWTIDAFQRFIYLKPFSIFSLITGFSIALSIEHIKQLGFIHKDLAGITSFFFLFIMTAYVSIWLLLRSYNEDKKRQETVEAARYMLSISGWVFFVTGLLT